MKRKTTARKPVRKVARKSTARKATKARRTSVRKGMSRRRPVVYSRTAKRRA